jgi:hypothetical protein
VHHGDKAFAMPPLKEIQDSGIKVGPLAPNAFEVNQFRPFQTLVLGRHGKMVGGTVVNTHPTTREAAPPQHTRRQTTYSPSSARTNLGSIQSGFFADLNRHLTRTICTVPVEQIKDHHGLS